MKKSLRLLAFATVLGTTLLTTACGSKNDDPQAQNQTAVLSGQVTPAGSVTAVTATDASGQTYTATLTSTGAYSFAAMKVGAYTLSFTPVAGYAAPAAAAVTLKTGGTTAPALTLAVANSAAGFKVDGTVVSTQYVFSQVPFNTSRYVRISVSPGGAPGPTIDFSMPGGVPVVGSYPLNTSIYNADYLAPDYTSYYSNYYGAPATSGTFTITSVNTTLRRFSATFNFIGGDPLGSSTSGNLPPGTPLTRTITDGFLNSIPY